MNFIQGFLANGEVSLGGQLVPIPGIVRSKLRRQSGDVIIGVRPEEFEDARILRDGARTVVPAQIEVTEQLGPETFAYFRVERFDVIEIGHRPVELAGALSARLDPRTNVSPGQTVDLAINLERLHVFDVESGASLLDR
jgi:multiple sugar transport system ATP-binding protein